MKFAVIGGDMRNVYLALLLRREGFEVSNFALDAAPDNTLDSCAISAEKAAHGAACAVLPLPVSNERGRLNAPLSAFSYDTEDILKSLPPGIVICAGKPDDRIRAAADNLGINIVDYFSREELVALNALATAEGTISLLLKNSPITIWDSRVLIIGFGRIGRMLAERLRALGAHVSVSARNAGDMAYIRTLGCAALETGSLGPELRNFDTVINTVPARVLGREQLGCIDQNTLVIDLASRPGGLDFEAAKDLNINVMWALGLPAETAPATAGKIIMETVLNIMREKGGDNCCPELQHLHGSWDV